MRIAGIFLNVRKRQSMEISIEDYLKKRIEQVSDAIKVLPENSFLRGELLAFNSILRKLEEENKK